MRHVGADVVGPVEDALLAQRARVQLHADQGEDGQHEDRQDHHVPQTPHGLQQGAHDSLQACTCVGLAPRERIRVQTHTHKSSPLATQIHPHKDTTHSWQTSAQCNAGMNARMQMHSSGWKDGCSG